MQREDFIDAPSVAAAGRQDGVRGAAPVRRPVHGGWILMVAAGLVAAVANYAVLTGGSPSATVSVVAVRAPAGTPTSQLQLVRQPLAVEDPAAHLLVTPDDLAAMAGMVTVTALDPGALLRTTDLRPPADGGNGAMSVPVDPARAAGGLLQAGDRVDVLAGDDGATGGTTVERVVADAEVLGVLDPGGALGSSSGYAVTLAVDADQAMALAAAIRSGDVDLVRTAGWAGGS